MGRLLIIDANMSTKVAQGLKERGRNAHALADIGLSRLRDPELLRQLASRDDDWVLVTADDKMPAEHGALVREFEPTIATVDGQWEVYCRRHNLTLNQDQFIKETVHRWVHVIEQQPTRLVRRYNPGTYGPWASRTRYE